MDLDDFNGLEVALPPMNTVADFIDALGGPTETAKLFGVGASAVSNWKGANKLPLRLYRDVHRICHSKMINTPDHLFGAERESVAS